MDITNGINNILNVIINIIKYAWDTLENITIWNTNLLQWTITLFILSIVIPIIFTIVKSGSAYGGRIVSERIRTKKGK